MKARTTKIPTKLPAMARKIHELLAKHSAGLDIVQIRELLGVGVSQEHLDRRVRSLRKYYIIKGIWNAGRYMYVLGGEKPDTDTDSGTISGKLRAQVLHAAKARCQMCGRTIAEDQIKLQVDHKIPQTWGGLTIPENLWAICEACNNGKRDYFSSFDEEEMKKIIEFKSVHYRIAYLLKLHFGKPVSSKLLQFAANATEVQEDWHKRLRDLRYPVIGLDIKSGRRKNPMGYIESTYTLKNWRDLPPDPAKVVREFEKKNKAAKRRSTDSER